MGLDWNPLSRPKPGSEAEFERLFEELDAGTIARGTGLLSRVRGKRKLNEAELNQRRARLQEISDPPFATLGAPRVGFDAAADEWLRGNLESTGKLDELDVAREKMHGYYVLDLLPPCDGFPRYTHYGMYDGLDRYSFRAKFLDDVQTIIGPYLHERAFGRMLARQLAAYADELDAVARPWAVAAGVAQIEQASESPPFEEDSPASKADVLFSAIRWCRFWSSRGHGLEPWF